MSADLRICISATLNRCLNILKKMLSKICYVQMDQTLQKKMKFSIKECITFTEGILYRQLHFSCSEICEYQHFYRN